MGPTTEIEAENLSAVEGGEKAEFRSELLLAGVLRGMVPLPSKLLLPLIEYLSNPFRTSRRCCNAIFGENSSDVWAQNHHDRMVI